LDSKNQHQSIGDNHLSKQKGRLLIGLLVLSLLQTSAWAGAGWTAYGRVVELHPTTAGRFLVQLNVRTNPSGCRDETWFYRDYTGKGAELMFHALLSAITTGIQARVYVTGRCDLNGYSEISSASISP
jgi:hypothetical protein